MQRIITSLFILLFMLALSSCATIAPPAPQVSKPWKEREQALKSIQSFKISGKIAVISARDSGSASVDWIETGDTYTISLMGPFGANAIKLRGRPGNITLDTANGQHLSASSPEELLAKQWGYHLPISYLKYWIRGLPTPALPAETHFDAYGRLDRLVQDGWTISYEAFTRVDKIDLPSKIFITSPTLKIKMIIYSWNVAIAH